MKLNQILGRPGSVRERLRVGRGIGSGKGKRAGRGDKGQNSRSGVAIKGFEGGQMPIHRRLPKRGFNNIFKKKYAEVNIGRLQSAIDKGKVDPKKPITVKTLMASGVVNRTWDGVRLLGKGKISSQVKVEVEGASQSAKTAIEKLGGTVTLLRSAGAEPLKGKKELKRTPSDVSQVGEEAEGGVTTA